MVDDLWIWSAVCTPRVTVSSLVEGREREREGERGWEREGERGWEREGEGGREREREGGREDVKHAVNIKRKPRH